MAATCPACHADIPAEDVNVAKGIMLCRACGQLSVIPGGETATDAEVPWSPRNEVIARPTRARTRCEHDGMDLQLHRRCGNLGTGTFLTLWMCGWTVGCIFLVRLAILKPSFEHILFAVPFLASWVFVAFLVVYNLFGFESLRIAREGLHYEWGAFLRVSRRDVPLNSVQRLSRFSAVADSETGRREHGLKLETTGRPIRFAKGADDEELHWLTDLIQRQLYTLQPGMARQALSVASRPTSARPGPRDVPEVLELRSPPLERPADSSLILTREHQKTTLTFCTALKPLLAGIGTLLFMNLFWNGIVSLFVWQLIRRFQWFLFFFLIPFEAIGLVLVGILVAALASPFIRIKWTFRPGEILKQVTVLGIGRTSTYELSRLARLELRNVRARKKRVVTCTDDEDDHSSRYSLVLVKPDGSDLVEISGLTCAEGRWLGNELLYDFLAWFVKVGQ